jgi:hypothetical protein
MFVINWDWQGRHEWSESRISESTVNAKWLFVYKNLWKVSNTNVKWPWKHKEHGSLLLTNGRDGGSLTVNVHSTGRQLHWAECSVLCAVGTALGLILICRNHSPYMESVALMGMITIVRNPECRSSRTCRCYSKWHFLALYTICKYHLGFPTVTGRATEQNIVY